MESKSNVDLLKDFEKEIADIPTLELLPHVEREAVFLVSEKLELSAAAMAVTLDDVQSVTSWIEAKELVKVDKSELEEIAVDSKKVHFLIIQPYVLIQKILSPQDSCQ